MATQICPYLHFKDARKAVEWLKDVAGFETLAVVEESGKVRHAEVRLGAAVIMLSEVDASKGQISATEGKVTGSVYIVMKDADALRAHHKHAKEADPASVHKDPYQTDYGSLDYALTHQGHSFYIGTYAPGTPIPNA